MIGDSKAFAAVIARYGYRTLSLLVLALVFLATAVVPSHADQSLIEIAREYNLRTPGTTAAEPNTRFTVLTTERARASAMKEVHDAEMSVLVRTYGALQDAVNAGNSPNKRAQIETIGASFERAEAALRERQRAQVAAVNTVPLPDPSLPTTTVGANGGRATTVPPVAPPRTAESRTAGSGPAAPRASTAAASDELPPLETPPGCAPGCAAAVCEAQNQGTALGQARAATIFDRTIRNVSAKAAIDAAVCIDRLFDKINEVTTAFNAIISSLNNPLIAILIAVASQILVQVVDQLLNSVVNAVCNAVNEITDAIENRLQNALCIKGDFGFGIDPLNFDVDIPAMQCSGWSIDLLSGQVLGQPIEGLNVDWGEVRAAGAAAADPDTQFARQSAQITGNTALTTTERNRRLNELRCNYRHPDCVR